MNGLQQLADTPLPQGYGDNIVFLRRWILDRRLQVKENNLTRQRLLKDAIRQICEESADDIANCLYSSFMKRLGDPAEEWPEQEADTPDDLPLDLPGPENE